MAQLRQAREMPVIGLAAWSICRQLSCRFGSGRCSGKRHNGYIKGGERCGARVRIVCGYTLSIRIRSFRPRAYGTGMWGPEKGRLRYYRNSYRAQICVVLRPTHASNGMTQHKRTCRREARGCAVRHHRCAGNILTNLRLATKSNPFMRHAGLAQW